ncbi:Auxin-responsive protein SAUR36 [Vitis vinifera]|uniref:Auxin-responsive protein SAUR36 n=2 Tax=Vitis vinifera TaxID=29760 RepID=A0A438JTN7_VITVI|nr:Auxin-responsive protein SAUR36 [Vitis vinifera]
MEAGQLYSNEGAKPSATWTCAVWIRRDLEGVIAPGAALGWRVSMINSKKLIKMARKWQKVAAIGRKRISLQRTNRDLDADCCSTSSVADKGHFVVYSSDRKRFVMAPSHCHVIHSSWTT